MSELELLRADLSRLGATAIQRQTFETDIPKARAALARAQEAGAGRPLSYALTVFNSESVARPRLTNRSVDVSCRTCGGDRFVVYSARLNTESPWMKEHGIKVPKGSITEEYAPCPDCNATANTLREGFKSPTPDQVRQRLAE